MYSTVRYSYEYQGLNPGTVRALYSTRTVQTFYKRKRLRVPVLYRTVLYSTVQYSVICSRAEVGVDSSFTYGSNPSHAFFCEQAGTALLDEFRPQHSALLLTIIKISRRQ